jgi:transcriptional regulator with GAF, ATPase, and Fis domain
MSRAVLSTDTPSKAPAGEIRDLHPALRQYVGRSVSLQSVLSDIISVAGTSCALLVEGESGTGKELTAKVVHEISCGEKAPFEVVNCGAIPESLLESELFGHVPGSFTGAVRIHRGVFERATDGTVFLDEIAEMSLSAQVKLLRVLQEGTFTPVGGEELRRSNARVVAATNKDLRGEVKKGNFRRDLFYRLNVYPIRLPPLRNRREDIPQLIDRFLDQYSKDMGRPRPRLNPAALKRLLVYSFPGNVRELQNIVSALLIESRVGAEITDKHVVSVFSRHRVQEGLSEEGDISDSGEDVRENLGRWVLDQLRIYHFNFALAERMLALRRKESDAPGAVPVCSRLCLTYYFQGEGLRALAEERWNLDAATIRIGGNSALMPRVKGKLSRFLCGAIQAMKSGGSSPAARLIALRKSFGKLPASYHDDLARLAREYEKGRWS